MIDAVIRWLQGTFWFVRKDAYPDFDLIMKQARDFADTRHETNPPHIPVRRNWADKVLTGKDDNA